MRRGFELVHRTRYTYDQEVTTSYGRAVLLPRDLPGQVRHRGTVTVTPEPADVAEEIDYFGNTTSYFAVTVPHRELEVVARSELTVERPDLTAADLPRATWEDVGRVARPGGTAEAARGGQDGTDGIGLVSLREALLPSRHVAFSDRVRTWAAPSFAPGRPVAEVLADLAHRTATELAYRPGTTTVTTTQVELLDQGSGVCQDFAHLMIAALRMNGVPARYTSGYLETQPPPGRPKLRGADASHAWVQAWVPGAGWIEVDPTNDCFADSRYVVLGWGRDYADLPPLRGVIFTEGSQSTLEVEVDLTPVEPGVPAEG